MIAITKPGVVVQCGLRDRSNWRRNNSALIPFASASGTILPPSPLNTANKCSSVAARISSVDMFSHSRTGISMTRSRICGGSHIAKLPRFGGGQFSAQRSLGGFR